MITTHNRHILYSFEESGSSQQSYYPYDYCLQIETAFNEYSYGVKVNGKTINMPYCYFFERYVPPFLFLCQSYPAIVKLNQEANQEANQEVIQGVIQGLNWEVNLGVNQVFGQTKRWEIECLVRVNENRYLLSLLLI